MPPAWMSPPRPLAFARVAPALIALGLLGMPLPATAALMRYEYSGVITRSDPSTGIAPGTPFAGVFAYEDEPGGTARQRSHDPRRDLLWPGPP